MTGSRVDVMVYLDDGGTSIYKGVLHLLHNSTDTVEVDWFPPGQTESQHISLPRSRVKLTYLDEIYTADFVAELRKITVVDIKDLKPTVSVDTRLFGDMLHEVEILEQLTPQAWQKVSYPRDRITFILARETQPE